MGKVSGIDVSKWQGNIDWQKVKGTGVQFAIIRAGYGRQSSQVDPRFHQNIKAAQEVGINCGAYWYSYATTPAEAREEAKVCLDTIKGYKLGYPVVFDIEDKCQQPLTNSQRTELCKAFGEVIENAGYYFAVYCNLNWWNNYLNKDELKQYDLWLAEWRDRPSIDCGIWQHTDKGHINGISGNVDLNFAFKDYPSIMKSKGLNGFAKSGTSSAPKAIKYVVLKGDTLSKIATKYNTTVSKIARDNGIANPDKIYAGQILVIK